jgi:hypothetical protein
MKQGKLYSFRLVPFLLLAILALFAGLWAGLARLGWQLNAGTATMLHGPLMVSGFLGTLIALERAAALRKLWMFAAPLLSGLGWIAGLAMPGLPLGAALITLGSLGLAGILLVMVRRETKIHTVVMGLGALCWLAGNVLWLAGLPIFRVVWFWAAFLVLTIAGERLELSRVLRIPHRVQVLFAFCAAGFLAGVAVSPWSLPVGTRIAGAGMLGLAAWLARFDIARRNLRHPNALTRYIALCLFAGYAWLAVSGLVTLIAGGQVAGAFYDAQLHAIFIGFAISMIFGHAPIIIPALTGLPVIFNRAFYGQLALLHASLILRIAGDLLGSPMARKWGGLLNEVAILLFLGLTAWTLARLKKKA